MDCISTGNNETGLDDNGLQDVFIRASWQDDDYISQNDALESRLSRYAGIPTRGDTCKEESAGDRKSLHEEGGAILFGLPPEIGAVITDEGNGQLIQKDKTDSKRRKEQARNLELPVCHITKQEGAENVDGRSCITILAGEVEEKEAKSRSGRSAKDTDFYKITKGQDIFSSLAHILAVVFEAISYNFPVSLSIGILGLLLMPTVGVGGDLTSVPVDNLLVIAKTAWIKCSTDKKQPVYWARTLVGSDEQQWLYYGLDGFHSNNADERFSIGLDETTGRYDLIIENFQHKDAGKYVCIDNNGVGDEASAELVVSDPMQCNSHIPSDGVMGNNVFGIDQGFIQVACSLTYTGNLSPTLEWSRPGADVQISEHDASTAKSLVTSTLKLSPSKELNGVKFQCEAIVKNKTQQGNSELQWKSETVIIKYADFVPKEVDACPGVEWNLVCNPRCYYSFEETKDHECRCLYTYYDNRTQKDYHVASHAVRCAKDNSNFQVVLITVAAVSVAFVATLTITVVLCLKSKSTKRHPGKAELRQVSFGEESSKPMLEKL